MLEFSQNSMQGQRSSGIEICCNTKLHQEMLIHQDLQLPALEKKETAHSRASDTVVTNASNKQKISLSERRRSMGDAAKKPSIKNSLSNFCPKTNIQETVQHNKENAEQVFDGDVNKKISLKHKKKYSNRPFLCSQLQEQIQAQLTPLSIENNPLSATLSHILSTSTLQQRAQTYSPILRIGQGLPTVRSQFAPTQPRSHTTLHS